LHDEIKPNLRFMSNMQALVSEKEALAALKDGAVLIAASSRLAADWKRRYAEAQPQEACETPGVYSWHAWLQERARLDEHLPLPLTPLQELDLWRQEIAADNADDARMTASQILALARQAARAHALMCEYGVNADDLLPGNAEHEAFHRWLMRVRQRLAAMPDRMLAAELPARLAGLALFPGGSDILLDGFDAPTPAQKRLLAAMKEQGVCIRSVNNCRSEAAVSLSVCEDEAHEVHHAAARIAALLQSRPDMRIGVFHPAPGMVAGNLSRELEVALAPASAFSASVPPAVLAGVPQRLVDAPMGCLAAFLLALAGRKQWRFAELSALLLSPYITGHETEAAARAGLEAALRKDNQHTIWLPTAITRDAWRQVPAFAGAMRHLMDWEPSRLLPSEWAQRVQAMWRHVLGLSAEIERSSLEVAQVNAMGEVLAALAGLDREGSGMTWGDFLAFLRQSLADRPITQTSAPQVSLLAMEEAPGLAFDHVFVLGMDEECWPQTAQPNPFIPVPVQQRAGMANASARHAFEASGRLWRHIVQSAPVVEVSFARQRQGKDVLASPMLHLTPRPAAAVKMSWRPLMPAPEIQAGAFDAVPLAGEKIPGGSWGLKEQSACPFRYFASQRLSISALEETEPGLSAKDRGSLVHRVLELIWKQLGDQASLLELLDDGDALESMIREAVHQSWSSIAHPVARDVRRLESRRLIRLLGEWLRLEASRPPFRVIESESWRTWKPECDDGRRKLYLKLDRVDEDAAGRRLIIDYKTGSRSSIGDWLGERPREPQLPLYAVAEAQAGHEPAAVGFARVRSGELGFEGVAAEQVDMTGVQLWRGREDEPDDWHDLVSLWQKRLQALACEIVEGRNEVAPRDEKACDYCDLRAVCRIDAMQEGVL